VPLAPAGFAEAVKSGRSACPRIFAAWLIGAALAASEQPISRCSPPWFLPTFSASRRGGARRAVIGSFLSLPIVAIEATSFCVAGGQDSCRIDFLWNCRSQFRAATQCWCWSLPQIVIQARYLGARCRATCSFRRPLQPAAVDHLLAAGQLAATTSRSESLLPAWRLALVPLVPAALGVST